MHVLSSTLPLLHASLSHQISSHVKNTHNNFTDSTRFLLQHNKAIRFRTFFGVPILFSFLIPLLPTRIITVSTSKEKETIKDKRLQNEETKETPLADKKKPNPIPRKGKTRQERKMRALVVCMRIRTREIKAWTREWSGGYHRQPTNKTKGIFLTIRFTDTA
jgi:hypothetical protein